MNILFVGKPGSGKGTITQNLIEDGFLQLSTGDLLRAEVKSETALGKEIAAIPVGQFASDEIIFTLVDKFLKENKDKSIIFDGFPRNKTQTQACINRGIVFEHIFLIDVSDDKVKERIVNRRVHSNSGRVYNVVTMPPKVEGLDDITGEPLTHRNDDKLEVIDQRLENYRVLTEPLLEVLKENGYSLNLVEGDSDLKLQLEQVKSTISKESNKKPKIS